MEEFYKNRSVSSCMAEGYQLYLHNFRNVIQKTWKEALATSFSFALLLLFATQIGSSAYWIKLSASAVLLVATMIFFKLRMYKSVDENPLQWKLLHLFKHIGFYFAYLLLAGTILLMIVVCVCVPLVIMLYATFSNYRGLQIGDPNGLPGYFPYFFFATAMLTMLVLLYLVAWKPFVRCYIHGSIISKENKK